MAKKIVAIIAGVSWAAVIIGAVLAYRNPGQNLAMGIMLQLGLLVAVGSTIAVIVLALIDYARRPR